MVNQVSNTFPISADMTTLTTAVNTAPITSLNSAGELSGVTNPPGYDRTKSYVSRVQRHGNIPQPYMLTDDNRVQWEMHFRAFFSYNQMSGIISSNTSIPDLADPSRIVWDEDNETVKSILLASLPTELTHRYSRTLLARDFWNQILNEKNSITVRCAAIFRKMTKSTMATSGAAFMKDSQRAVNELRDLAPECPDSVLLGMVLGCMPPGNSDVENLFSTLVEPSLTEGMRQLTTWLKNRHTGTSIVSLVPPTAGPSKINAIHQPNGVNHQRNKRKGDLKLHNAGVKSNRGNKHCDFCKSYIHNTSECRKRAAALEELKRELNQQKN